MRRKYSAHYGIQIASYCWPLLLWYLVSDSLGCINVLLLPHLTSVLKRLNELLTGHEFYENGGATLYRWAIGFFIGALSGVVIGLLLGFYRRLYQFFEFSIEFARAMPITAIFPLFLIVFGIGDASKIAMVGFATFLILVVNTSYGVRYASRARIHMARAFRATEWQIFSSVIVYEALPLIFIGLRLATSLSLVVTVVSEMFIGTERGIGQKIFDSYLTNSVTSLYSYLLLLGIIGYSFNKTIIGIERHIIHWGEVR